MKFPIFIENSRLPIWLSKIVPIDVYAFSFAIWVVCRGEMSDKTKNHETIHYVQQKEMLFIFQWLAYGAFWLVNFIRSGNGAEAYYKNPFEEEAYENDSNLEYLKNRKPYAWIKYI